MPLWTPDTLSPLWWFDGGNVPTSTFTTWTDTTTNFSLQSSAGSFNGWLYDPPKRYPNTTLGTGVTFDMQEYFTMPLSYTLACVAPTTQSSATGYITRGCRDDVSTFWGTLYKAGRKLETHRQMSGAGYVQLRSSSDIISADGFDCLITVQTFQDNDFRDALRVNGAPVSMTDISVSGTAVHASGNTRFQLGPQFGGAIAMLLFTSVLSTENIEKLEGYLYHHYKADAELNGYITLSGSHPYYSSAPTTPNSAETWLLTC